MNAIPESYNGKPLRHAWPYRSPVGDVVGIVARYQNGTAHKDVVPFFRQNGAGWAAGASPDPRPLFGLEYVKADPDRRAVLVVEGERAAAALQSLGLCAVTSQGGSKAAHKSDWGPVSGFASAFLLPDNDAPGMSYARDVFALLQALEAPPVCHLLTLPDLPEAGDVVDFIQARCPGWDGFQPVPEPERERLLAELRALVKDAATPIPDDWTQAEKSDWEAPVSLETNHLPAWPAGVFPGSIEEFVRGLAEATETPVELPALFTLAALSTAAQGKFQVCIKAGYVEPVNVWTCPALVPGSRKSAVKASVTAPLVKWEREQRQAMEADIKAAASEQKTIAERVAAMRKKCAQAKGMEAESMSREIADLEASMKPIPIPPQVFTDDVTAERLGSLMADHGERMAILSDEAGVFENMAGRYSAGVPNLDVYLQGHAGSAVRVDRGSRPSVFMYRPALTIGISPQPDVLRGLTSKPGFRGRGLLARFLYAMPEPNLGQRTGQTRPLSEDMRLRWEGRLTAILNAPMATGADGEPMPHTLKLTPEAFASWQAFWCEVEKDMGPGGRFEFMTDWAGKLPGAVARLAGLLHIARHVFRGAHTQEIDLADMSKAIQVGRCLSVHALAVFDLMGADPALDGARAVLGWIRAEGLQVFTFRDCHNRHQGRFKRAEELDPVLEVLAERGYIRRARTPGHQGRGRPSKVFEVNPAAHSRPVDMTRH